MILTRFEALGLLPSRNLTFQVWRHYRFGDDPAARECIAKGIILDLERLSAELDSVQPQLVYKPSRGVCGEKPIVGFLIKLNWGVYLKPDKRKVERFLKKHNLEVMWPKKKTVAPSDNRYYEQTNNYITAKR